MRFPGGITFIFHTKFMSSILYYSKHCPICQNLLSELKKHPRKDDLHFLSVDKRELRDGRTFLLMDNGEAVPLPPSVSKVPALLLLDRGCMCIFGQDVMDRLLPRAVPRNREAVQAEVVPDSFSFGQGQFGGVSSDNYSFWDQSAQDLEAKGNGGMRQQHHYANLTTDVAIRTPPDTWAPDKVSPASLKKMEKQRGSLGNPATHHHVKSA